jgi:hypothetical protein
MDTTLNFFSFFSAHDEDDGVIEPDPFVDDDLIDEDDSDSTETEEDADYEYNEEDTDIDIDTEWEEEDDI